MGVMKVMKTAQRQWLAAGGGAGVDVPTPAGQAHTAALTTTGTVYVTPGVNMPLTVYVELMQGAARKGIQTAKLDATHKFSVTFPANTAVAGAATVRVTSATSHSPFVTSSGSFTFT
jgi:hypothetical protein